MDKKGSKAVGFDKYGNALFNKDQLQPKREYSSYTHREYSNDDMDPDNPFGNDNWMFS